MKWLSRLFAPLFVVLVTLYYVVPLLAMARFSFQRIPVFALHWSNLFDKWTLDGLKGALDDSMFWPTLWLSIRLAVLTVILVLVLLTPTLLYAHLKAPKWRPVIEGLCGLPWAVPPIALVVGVAGTFRAVDPTLLASHFSLVPLYGVLALPFTARSLDAGIRAIDLRTLTEASRNLGAGWWTTLLRVVAPNLRSALLGSTFLTITVVLGEYAMASLLLKPTFPIFLAEVNGRQPQGGMALNLFAMLLTASLLLIISALTHRRRGADSRPSPKGPLG